MGTVSCSLASGMMALLGVQGQRGRLISRFWHDILKAVAAATIHIDIQMNVTILYIIIIT